MPLIVGTRRSKLALVQTYLVRDRLEERGYDVDIKKIVTEGDERKEIGEMGAFVNEINRQLMKGDIDVAVHSLKDVP
ncbi:MAG: porphobilinogen deaminase, partial [Candidatus Methanolliviera hydrocarbonicum]